MMRAGRARHGALHLVLISYLIVRMTWWFIILGCSALVVVCVAIALYLRVRRHMNASKSQLHDDPDAVDHKGADTV